MRHFMLVVALALICTGAVPWAQGNQASEDRVIGRWTGTFDGDSTGKVTILIARDEPTKLGGTIEVAFDEGEGYTATFRTVTVDGSAVTLAYDTPGEGANIQLDGTREGNTLKGTWKAFEPGTSTVTSSGSFTTSKQ